MRLWLQLELLLGLLRLGLLLLLGQRLNLLLLLSQGLRLTLWLHLQRRLMLGWWRVMRLSLSLSLSRLLGRLCQLLSDNRVLLLGGW